jgi:hypothetical protein
VICTYEENPFYTQPEVFLRELNARERKGAAAMT